MSYSTSNPPRLIASPEISSASGKTFLYEAASTEDIRASGYFTDGTKYGMGLGDLLIFRRTDAVGSAYAGLVTAHSVTAISSAAGTGITAALPKAVTIN